MSKCPKSFWYKSPFRFTEREDVWNSEIMNGADRPQSDNYSWYSEDAR